MSPAPLSLTPRRGETLAVLRRLSGERGGGVHYSDVGRAMGISAWTAYALLRELERVGLASRRPAGAAAAPARTTFPAPPGAPARGGRSRIIFSPLDTLPPAAELVERLRRAVDRFAVIADDGAAARVYLTETLQGANGDLALHLGFWMARLVAAGRTTQEALRSVLESAALPRVKIQTVAAMGLGTELGRLDGQRLSRRVVAAVTRLSARLDEAQRSSDAALAALVEAAQGLLPATGVSPAAVP